MWIASSRAKSRLTCPCSEIRAGDQPKDRARPRANSTTRARPCRRGNRVRRREFITLVGGAAAAWPLFPCAQQATPAAIGFLGTERDINIVFATMVKLRADALVIGIDAL